MADKSSESSTGTTTRRRRTVRKSDDAAAAEKESNQDDALDVIFEEPGEESLAPKKKRQPVAVRRPHELSRATTPAIPVTSRLPSKLRPRVRRVLLRLRKHRNADLAEHVLVPLQHEGQSLLRSNRTTTSIATLSSRETRAISTIARCQSPTWPMKPLDEAAGQHVVAMRMMTAAMLAIQVKPESHRKQTRRRRLPRTIDRPETVMMTMIVHVVVVVVAVAEEEPFREKPDIKVTALHILAIDIRSQSI